MANKSKKKGLEKVDIILLILTIIFPIILFPIGLFIAEELFEIEFMSIVAAVVLVAVFAWISTMQAFRRKYNSKVISLICGILVLIGIFSIIITGERINIEHSIYPGLFNLSIKFFSHIIPFVIMFAIIYALGSSKKTIKSKRSWIVLIVVGTILVFAFSIGCFVFCSWAEKKYMHLFENIKKPIIYIYPKRDMDVEVTVSNPEKFTVTYPKYEDGWKVKALKDGTLIDKNNKKYYALYWEGNGDKDSINKDGFVVKGEDSAKFLEEKLEILGLNYKERDEFIMYWLPKLESNKYNYVRFQTIDEINNNMKLNINPEPDTLIRVMMEYKGLDKRIKVKEEKLTKVERKGYTVVEWGGTEIK